ncbi:hypothetical protein [Psychromonas hadalis]|nr:hypothetical protein [Psychromonas hadalis]
MKINIYVEIEENCQYKTESLQWVDIANEPSLRDISPTITVRIGYSLP